MELVRLATIARHFVAARRRWVSLRGDALTRYQDERAHKIVAYAAAHAPFYAAHWASHDLTEWRTLPVVDKRLMMEHFDTFNTAGLTRDEAMAAAIAAEHSHDFRPTVHGLTVGLSSGTSGHRGLFVATGGETAGWAGVMLARALHSWQGRLRVAFFLRANSNLYESIGGSLIQFRYFDLMLPLDEAVARLNLFLPDVIVGPPSLLGMLARERRVGHLRARPRRLISVAEVLEPQDRLSITEAFDAPVHEIYQCTEGLLAISCAHGSLHLQEDLIAAQTEPVPGSDSADGRVTPIITDLWRWTQPIIRYRLNDVWRMRSDPCSCGSGFRVIEAIEGRCDDVCVFVRRDGGSRIFFPDTIRRMVLLASDVISDYEATQTQPGELHIGLTLRTDADAVAAQQSVRESVRRILAEYDCLPAQLTIDIGLAPHPAMTKRRRVRNLAPATAVLTTRP